MTDTTLRLKLPYIVESQAQKEVTHNETLNILDVLLHPVAEGITDIPPCEAENGQCWIVGDNPTEEWKDKAYNIAQKVEGGWFFVKPIKMLRAWIEVLEQHYIYNGEAWVPEALIMKKTGESLRVEHKSEIIKLLGESVITNIQIPARALVITVNVRVLKKIKGAASFNVGVKDDKGRYGNNIGSMLDSSNIGISYHPVAYYQETSITITANEGAFKEGEVHLSIQYLQPKGPWSW